MKKYQAIMNLVKQQIDSGKLKQGERLPSVREIAQLFEVNKITVNKAYQELEKEHLVYSIPRSGYYVIEQDAQAKRWSEEIDFVKVMPQQALLPYREFAHSINQAVVKYQDLLFNYTDQAGLFSLRKTLQEEFTEQGIYTDLEQLVIVNGAQQALSLLLRLVFPNNQQAIVVEEPTYQLMIRMIKKEKLEVLPVTRTPAGIDLLQLEAAFQTGRVKFFYTMPRFHSPLGTSLSVKEKAKILHLAERYQVFIVEDDFLGDLNQNKGNLPLHYYDIHGRVIYIRSFSKTFMPGLRLGAVVLPQKLLKGFLEEKYLDDLNTSLLNQGALDVFIKSGMYQRHLQKIRPIYLAKLVEARRIVDKFQLAGVNWYIPETGIFIWVTLPPQMDQKELVKVLLAQKIIVATGECFYLQPQPGRNVLRLCIINLSLEELRKGLHLIGESLKKLLLF